MEDILESDSGLFSKDQTLAAFRHARNRQYLCVYSWLRFLISSTPLRVHRRWQVLRNSVDASLTLPRGGTNHRGRHCCPRLCSCWHPCSKLPSHPKSHYIILSSCVYPHFSLKELWRIMCSHVSFLYCQNVSVGDQLGERSWYTVQRFFLSLFEAIWTFSL